jgi:hypothetical protein
MAVLTLVARGWRVRGRAPLPLRPDLAMLALSIVTLSITTRIETGNYLALVKNVQLSGCFSVVLSPSCGLLGR